jgi:SAM-dependent methyltransferase
LTLKTSGRILDVGCGDCLVLLHLQRLGWDVFGLEPRENAAALAREKFELDVRSGYLDTAGFEPGFFDAVTLIHVFEHVHKPDAMARQISQLLAPDGLALIETPNFDSFESKVFRDRWVAVDAPRHLYHFTPETLTAMLENNNLRVLRICHGSDPAIYKMGYSESLRQIVSDWGIKKYPKKHVLNANALISTGPKVDSTARRIESFFFRATGVVANSLKMGGRITAIAQKK